MYFIRDFNRVVLPASLRLFEPMMRNALSAACHNEHRTRQALLTHLITYIMLGRMPQRWFNLAAADDLREPPQMIYDTSSSIASMPTSNVVTAERSTSDNGFERVWSEEEDWPHS